MFSWIFDNWFFCNAGGGWNQESASSESQQQKAMNYRAEADEWAKKKRDCSQRSQAAYSNGDKAEASRLSKQSKLYAEKMNKANWKAARAILKPQRSKKTGRLDLHGLYLEEAKAATFEFLDHWRDLPKSNRPETVQIITGAGKHSKIKGQPIIRPEVEKILRLRALEYTCLNGDGGFLVDVSTSENDFSCIIM